MTYVVEFPQPDKPMNLNDRLHWAQRAKRSAAWRHAAHAATVDAVNRHALPTGLPFIMVRLVLPVRSVNVRRDPHNFFATVKPCVDALVDAGVVADDDSSHVATLEPGFVKGGLVRLEITDTKGTT